MPNAIQGLLAPAEMRATPRKNKLMGLLADALTAANDYAQRPDATMPGGKANPVLGLLADAVALPSMATTAQRVSYGEPLTNGLRGSKAFLKPETADVAMMAPISPRNALAALGMVGGMADNGAMRAATVIAPNAVNKEHLEKVIEEMKVMGAPSIRSVWDEGMGVYRALEGSHRLRAAKRLGLTPNLVEVPERSWLKGHDFQELPEKTSVFRVLDYLNGSQVYVDFPDLAPAFRESDMFR